MFFSGNEFSSRLNAKVASQLNSDYLKEHRTGLGDVQLPRHPPSLSSISVLILGWAVFFWSAFLKQRREDVSFTGKNSVQEGRRLKDSSVLGLKIFFPLEKNVTEHQQQH